MAIRPPFLVFTGVGQFPPSRAGGVAVAGGRPEERRRGPQAEAARQDLAALKKLAADPKADVDEVWKRYLTLRLNYPGTAECVEVAKVPSPLDKLDGDVSRKEFLDGEELFRQIDTDGDGLISLAEAEAFCETTS